MNPVTISYRHESKMNVGLKKDREWPSLSKLLNCKLPKFNTLQTEVRNVESALGVNCFDCTTCGRESFVCKRMLIERAIRCELRLQTNLLT